MSPMQEEVPGENVQDALWDFHRDDECRRAYVPASFSLLITETARPHLTQMCKALTAFPLDSAYRHLNINMTCPRHSTLDTVHVTPFPRHAEDGGDTHIPANLGALPSRC